MKKDILLAEISKSMYGDIPKRFKGYNVKNLTIGTIEVAVFWNDYESIVAFAGTEIYKPDKVIDIDIPNYKINKAIDIVEDIHYGKYADWEVNLSISKKTTALGEVHEGFYEASKLVYDNIAKVVKHLNRDKVYMIGHSQGASLSIITGRLLAEEIGKDKIEIVSFAPARVGNKKFAKSFKDINIRYYVNNNDIVCRLPPKRFGYKHIGKEIYFNRNGDIVKLNWLAKLVDKTLGLATIGDGKINLFDHVVDHNIDRYIENLKEAYL